MKRKILFFVNRFNDIDHTAPVVWECSNRGMEVEVRSLNPFLKIERSERLKYLKRNGIKVRHLYPAWLRIPGVKNLTDWNKVVGKKILGEEWHDQQLENIKPDCVVMDHAAQNGLYGVRHMRTWARANRVPLIDIPHGIMLYKVSPPDYDRGFSMLKEHWRTFLVIPHEWYKADCVKHGMDRDKIRVLGSPRFDAAWRKTLYEEVLPKASPMEPPHKMKRVVFFEMGADRYHDLKERVKRAVYCIAGLPGLHIKLKPQPRNNRVHYEIPAGIEVDARTDSIDLIRWCDVVLCLNSSIMLEPYFQGKPIIYPKYWHEEEMIFEDYDVVETVRNDDELIGAITASRNIAKNRNEAFERDLIGENPLKAYGDLIEAVK